jgi:hypothetical protein
MTGNPKKPKYPVMWNPDLLIDYYYKNNEDSLSLKEKYQFLQTKVSIQLGYLHMLRPQEAWSCEVVDKPELQLEINKSCWLRTIFKNDKTNISDICIPNIDLLISQEIKNNNVKQKDRFSNDKAFECFLLYSSIENNDNFTSKKIICRQNYRKTNF